MKISAVFDLDGTLLYTLGDIAAACNKALSEFGYPLQAEDKFRYFLGDGTDNLIRRAMPQNVSAEERQKVTKIYLAEYAAHPADLTHPYDGVREMLEEFKASGAKMAVVSNKPHDRTVELMEHFFPKIFDVVLGQKPGVPIKPDPYSVNEALRLLDCPKNSAFYLGDTATDIKTAENAGLYRCGAVWGFRGEEELITAGASTLAYSPVEVFAKAKEFWEKK